MRKNTTQLTVDQKLDFIIQEIGIIKHDVAGLKTDVSVLKNDVSELKKDVKQLKKDVVFVKKELIRLEKKMDFVSDVLDKDITKVVYRTHIIENHLGIVREKGDDYAV